MTTTRLRFLSQGTIYTGRFFRACAQLLLVCSFVVLLVGWSWAAIPGTERTTLLNLYTSTNGASWTFKDNWNGAAGTECTWFGVTCDITGSTVVSISLYFNNLSGSLPDLSSLTNLQYIDVSSNQLTGSIPSLSTLINLQHVDVDNNLLSGPIPSLAGLTSLQIFWAYANQLTGSIPSLTGLSSLNDFEVDANQLSGTIPPLSGLTSLQYFYVFTNHLTGPIPSLSGLSSLQDFEVFENQLTGSIPSLTGLTGLRYFDVDTNQLTGSMPSLTGLTGLQHIYVYNNLLTGNVPAVPSPDNLISGGSQLCPNYLTQTSDANWDTATGISPWYQTCTTYKVRIAETVADYSNIQSAYNAAVDGQTIEAQAGVGSQVSLTFNNPFYVKLIGGFNPTDPTFTTDTGTTIVIGNITISSGTIEIANIIIL